MKAILMAGGSGTRLWPLSRKNQPKQIHPFLNNRTLLERSYTRLRKNMRGKDVYVATAEQYSDDVVKLLKGVPKKNITAEPIRRETAPAFALSLLKILKTNPKETVVYVNADNHVHDEKEFGRMLKVAGSVVGKMPDQLVLLGVRPTYPETGYGYIKMGSPVMQIKKDEVFEVERFIEKPNKNRAKKFISLWEYLWNPTLIVGRAEILKERFKKYQPKLWQVMEKIQPAIGTKGERRAIRRYFKGAPSVTIDHGILEHDKKMLVIPADFGWTDVGNWRTMHEIQAETPKDNVVGKLSILHDADGNLLFSASNKLIAAVGVKDTILIETKDAILLCSKDRAQDVKKIVKELEKRKLRKYL